MGNNLSTITNKISNGVNSLEEKLSKLKKENLHNNVGKELDKNLIITEKKETIFLKPKIFKGSDGILKVKEIYRTDTLKYVNGKLKSRKKGQNNNKISQLGLHLKNPKKYNSFTFGNIPNNGVLRKNLIKFANSQEILNCNEFAKKLTKKDPRFRDKIELPHFQGNIKAGTVIKMQHPDYPTSWHYAYSLGGKQYAYGTPNSFYIKSWTQMKEQFKGYSIIYKLK